MDFSLILPNLYKAVTIWGMNNVENEVIPLSSIYLSKTVIGINFITVVSGIASIDGPEVYLIIFYLNCIWWASSPFLMPLSYDFRRIVPCETGGRKIDRVRIPAFTLRVPKAYFSPFATFDNLIIVP